MPAISEVLEAIEDEERRLRSLHQDIEVLSDSIESKQDSYRRWQEEQIVKCFHRLEWLRNTGNLEEDERAERRAKITADYSAYIVAEAQAHLDAGHRRLIHHPNGERVTHHPEGGAYWAPPFTP